MGLNLKKPEEVKEYLKNLFVEYNFGCFKEKNPEVCHRLGEYTEAIKKDFKRAGVLFKMTCDEYSYGKSCSKYGTYRYLGKGSEKDEVEAYKYMVKGCDNGSATACYHAGVLSLKKEDADEKEADKRPRIHKGMEMLKTSCYAKELPEACFFLSGVYLSGMENYVPKNYKEAYQLSLKCCDLGNPFACMNVSQMYKRGDGVPKNPDLAETFKTRGTLLYEQLKGSQKQVIHELDDDS